MSNYISFKWERSMWFKIDQKQYMFSKLKKYGYENLYSNGYTYWP
jgi:hypothetical protein